MGIALSIKFKLIALPELRFSIDYIQNDMRRPINELRYDSITDNAVLDLLSIF